MLLPFPGPGQQIRALDVCVHVATGMKVVECFQLDKKYYILEVANYWKKKNPSKSYFMTDLITYWSTDTPLAF